MPTIKGGLKLGKHSTQEDLDKLSKAMGKTVYSKTVAAKGEKVVKKKPVKKKVVKEEE